MYLLMLMIVFGAGLATGAGLMALNNSRRDRSDRLTRGDRRRLDALDALVDEIKDIAYRQMPVDPTLATIVVDEIATFERNDKK